MQLCDLEWKPLFFGVGSWAVLCLKLYERPVFVFSGEVNGVLLVSLFMVRLMTSCMFLDLPVDRSSCTLSLYAESVWKGAGLNSVQLEVITMCWLLGEDDRSSTRSPQDFFFFFYSLPLSCNAIVLCFPYWSLIFSFRKQVKRLKLLGTLSQSHLLCSCTSG